jgi:hypothetical protein
MARTFCLMIAAAVVAVGCRDAETPKSNGGNVNGNAKRGSGRKAVSLPDDLPADVPIYPGAKPTHVGTSEGGIRQSPSTSLQLETTDSVGEVCAFYEEQMQDQSWTIGYKTPAILNAKKGKRNLNVTIVEMPRSPGTVAITIIYN